jgi:hypothetical protein
MLMERLAVGEGWIKISWCFGECGGEEGVGGK